MKSKPRFHSDSGFTLIEVVWASGVILVAFVLMAGTLVSLHRGRTNREYQTFAVTIAASVLDELTRLDEPGLLAYVPPEFASEVPFDVEVRYQLEDGVTVVSPPLAPESVDLPSPLSIEVEVDVHPETEAEFVYLTSTVVRP